jgi:hypothetical protein
VDDPAFDLALGLAVAAHKGIVDAGQPYADDPETLQQAGPARRGIHERRSDSSRAKQRRDWNYISSGDGDIPSPDLSSPTSIGSDEWYPETGDDVHWRASRAKQRRDGTSYISTGNSGDPSPDSTVPVGWAESDVWQGYEDWDDSENENMRRRSSRAGQRRDGDSFSPEDGDSPSPDWSSPTMMGSDEWYPERGDDVHWRASRVKRRGDDSTYTPANGNPASSDSGYIPSADYGNDDSRVKRTHDGSHSKPWGKRENSNSEQPGWTRIRVAPRRPASTAHAHSSKVTATAWSSGEHPHPGSNGNRPGPGQLSSHEKRTPDWAAVQPWVDEDLPSPIESVDPWADGDESSPVVVVS